MLDSSQIYLAIRTAQNDLENSGMRKKMLFFYQKQLILLGKYTKLRLRKIQHVCLYIDEYVLEVRDRETY